MKRNLIVATWSWLVVTVLLEVVLSTRLSTAAWGVRGGFDSLIGLSGVVPLILFYMGLWDEHLSVKMFVVVSLFFCADLILIWSASSVH